METNVCDISVELMTQNLYGEELTAVLPDEPGFLSDPPPPVPEENF